MSSVKHIIIYSHGFGVRKEDRGLFTAVAKAVPDAQHVMFNYNPINESANTVTVAPIDEQVRKLKKVLNMSLAGLRGGGYLKTTIYS
jgi:hypothetical protein